MKLATPATPLPVTIAVALAAALAACGSSAPAATTVTAPPVRTTSSTSSTTSTSTSVASATTGASTAPTTSSSSTTASSTATTSASTTSSTTSTSTTRTETAPAFVGTNPTGGAVGHDLTAAIAVLARNGYTPVGTAAYDAGDTLRVLIGRRTGTAGERAFFFDQTIYLGTDASAPSAQITLLDENDTEVTLGYAIYRSGAAAPSGQRAVRFQLDMGQLSALDPLPSVAARR